MIDFTTMGKVLLAGDRSRLIDILQKVIDGNMAIDDILQEGLIRPMQEIGIKFKNNELWVPDVLVAARAALAGLDFMRPYKQKSGKKPLGTVVLGTVEGDIHALGRQIVGVMLESANIKVVDLGEDVPPEEFVKAAKSKQANIIGMSSFLISTVSSVEDTIKAVQKGRLDGVKTMVGGYAISHEFADSVGADAYAPEAFTAVNKAKELLKSKKAP